MCPYVHYILDDASAAKESCDLLHTPQQQAYFDSHLKESIENPISCIQADLRGFALEKVCGSRYRAVLIDPPWSISMKLPFPSLRDPEIENLKIPKLLDRSKTCYVFLWATQKKIPVARGVLTKWGATQTHDICWVKLNQLNRLVSAGRTGYYFNHAKETCIVGIFKAHGNNNSDYERFAGAGGGASVFNQQVVKDSDVICSKVREVSRKPDEVYGIINRLVGQESKKIELFARNWNVVAASKYKNWVAVGNQIRKTEIDKDDLELKRRFQQTYPEFAN